MNIDLEPGAYRERKPKGWRWALPWSHADDVKLPLVMLVIALGFIVYFLINTPTFWITAGACVFAFGAGSMMTLWLRD